MSLEDFIRTLSRDPQDAIDQVEGSLENLRRDRDGAHARADRARGKVEEILKSGPKDQHRAASIEGQIRELTQKIRGLEQDLRDQQLKLAEISKVEEERSRKEREQKKLIREAVEEARGFQREIEEKKADLERHMLRLKKARKEALRKHLQDVEKRMLELQRSQKSTEAARSSRHALEEARHNDPAVAAWWEERESWLRILESSPPGGVAETVRSELERIEQAVEKRFPGALDIKDTKGTPSEIEELFYSTAPGETGCLVFLPIDQRTWTQLEEGSLGPTQEVAMATIWALAKALPEVEEEAGTTTDVDIPALQLRVQPDRLEEVAAFRVNLGNEAAIDFVFSPLPHDVNDAIGR